MNNTGICFCLLNVDSVVPYFIYGVHAGTRMTLHCKQMYLKSAYHKSLGEPNDLYQNI